MLSACDTAPESQRVVATGVVMDSTLLAPAEGVTVALIEKGGGFGASFNVAQTRTDAHGRFRLEYEPFSAYGVHVEVRDSAFFPTWYGVGAGETERTVWLHRTARLTVIPRFSAPLGPNDTYFVTLPGLPGPDNAPLTTNYAKANAFNDVAVVVRRNGVRTSVTGRVYCPVGEHTRYTFDM